MKLRLHRDQLVSSGLCSDSISFFNQFAQEDGWVEFDWTSAEELAMQVLAPDYLAWLRYKRLIPFTDLSGCDLTGLPATADLRGLYYDGDPPPGWIIVDGRLRKEDEYLTEEP